MQVTIHEQGGSKVAVIASGEPVLQSVQDALDLLATMRHVHDCGKILLPKETVSEEFFDLRSGLAGEVLQKFTNYGVSVAFVGDFSVYGSKALRDFIRESNRAGKVLFLPTEEEALAGLHRQ